MKTYNELNIADMHIPDRKYKHEEYDEWVIKMFLESFKNINKIILKHNIKKINLLGDVFDSVPKGTSLDLFRRFIEGLPECVEEIYAISGNHCLMTGISKKLYYLDEMKDYLKEQYGVQVFSYEEHNKALYCSHEHLHKLERLKKHHKIIYSHFRSGLDVVADELDIVPMMAKADLIVTGDIHKRLAYENIVYCGSNVDTHFGADNLSEGHTPSVLLLNTETLDWKWEDTLTDKYRKVKVVYNSVKAFEQDVERLRLEHEKHKHFYKVVVQDKKVNLRRLKGMIPDYKHFCKFETVRVDLEVEKQNKEVVTKIKENLSKDNVSDSLLEFILKNNDREELRNNIEAVYTNYEKGLK